MCSLSNRKYFLAEREREKMAKHANIYLVSVSNQMILFETRAQTQRNRECSLSFGRVKTVWHTPSQSIQRETNVLCVFSQADNNSNVLTTNRIELIRLTYGSQWYGSYAHMPRLMLFYMHTVFIDCVRYIWIWSYSLRLFLCCALSFVRSFRCFRFNCVSQFSSSGIECPVCNGNPLCRMENGWIRRDEGKCVCAAYAFHIRVRCIP